MLTKEALRAAIVARLEEELAVLTAGAASSRQEATDGENRQEGRYDMRAQLAAYLAAGQGKLAVELSEAIAAYRALSTAPLPPGSVATVGALATIESGQEKTFFYLGPARGGLELEVGGMPVTVITPASPLGRLLLGKPAGASLSPGQKLAALQ